MAKRQNDSFSIQDLMKDVLTENNLSKGMLQMQIKEVWAKVMGNGVASYTRSVELKRDTLWVSLSSSALKQELGYGKDKIVSNINEELQKELVKSIRFL